MVNQALEAHNYELDRRLSHHTHDSGRTLDGIITTSSLSSIVYNKKVLTSYRNSDHYPVLANINTHIVPDLQSTPNPQRLLCWKKATNSKRHDIPMWRERIASFKTDVDYWLQQQFVHGGPTRCPYIIRQLRLAKSRYRFQIRVLRREIKSNIAETVTLDNCHRKLFKMPKLLNLL